MEWYPKILVNETSSRRAHRYVSPFVNAKSGEMLYITEGKTTESVEAFAEAMKEHGARLEQIEWVGMDMSPAFIKEVEKCFPKARKVFDCFSFHHLRACACLNAPNWTSPSPI